MQEPLFSITCTTCQARLKVLSEAGIGTIQACPKCGSMVQLIPPPGWQPKPRAPEAPAAPPVAAPPPTAPQPTSHAAAPQPPASAAVPQPPPLPVATSAAQTSPPAAETSPAASALRPWLFLGVVPITAVAVAVGTWVLFRSSTTAPPVPAPPASQTSPTPPPKTDTEPAPEKPAPRPQRRWLPDDSRLLYALNVSRLARNDQFALAVDSLGPTWRATLDQLFRGFGLKTHAVAQLYLASTDPTDWPNHCVAVIELQKDQDAGVFQIVGQSADLSVAGVRCRRLPAGSWPHPFAVLGPQTIVTGSADLLTHLSARTRPHLSNSALARLLDTCQSDADVLLLADLDAARRAGWQPPTALLDASPTLRKPWRLLWEIPQAVCLTTRTADRTVWEVGLDCDGDTSAQRLQAAIDEFLPAAKADLQSEAQWAATARTSGKVPAAAAAQYAQLLQHLGSQIDAVHRQVAGSTVWIRLDESSGAGNLLAAAWANRATIRTRWLDKARTADSANHRRLLESLGACTKAEGSFPSGAGGGALLPPQTRLSWIASLLPYLQHPDWHQQLEFGYSWNGAQNRAVASRPLGEVVNPALGPATTEAGFPVTHYVGVAGVGADAGQLKPGEPRAGLFGYSRRTRPDAIPDGAANTIATLGVQDHLGPWAAGGDSTVRPLTQRPYVNGPDGFGSGQPNGMLAGMADGSVRFLSKDIDPTVLEQLATVGGGEPVTASILDPTPDVPAQPANQPSAPPVSVAEQTPSAAPAKPQPGGPRKPIVFDEARLSDRIPKVELSDMSLLHAARLLSQMSTVPISFDLDSLAAFDVSLSDPVNIQATDVTVSGVLDALAASKGLAYVVDKGQVVLTAPQDYRTVIRSDRTSLADLVEPDTPASALADQVRRMVAPDSWIAAGGRGTLQLTGTTLTLTQTRDVSDQVDAFCERLRMARGLPPRNRSLAKRLTLQTRVDQARPMLDRPITANYHQPTPLTQILTDLEHQAQATLLVDWQALAEQGLSPQVEATLHANKLPLEEALAKLLQPLAITYRAYDRQILEITTPKAVAARMELEFYPVADLLAPDTAVAQLAAQVKDTVGGATWHEAAGPAAIAFDAPSKHLIVLQTQPNQVAIQTLLTRLKSDRPQNK